ncbi:MAG: hypothetical protein Q9195_009199 [Heterodermia aff. obscurata]
MDSVHDLPSPTQSLAESSPTLSTAAWEREEQEAEILFCQRVKELCQIQWPSPKSVKRSIAECLRTIKILRPLIPTPMEPLIERLRGGDLNHITSITIPWLSEEQDRNLILRVPQWDQSRLDREVAILEYVRQKSNIPVATIRTMDYTCGNVLEKPYVLQSRIPGCDVRFLWEGLTFLQRCDIAHELGDYIRTLLSLESPRAGLVEFNNATSTRGDDNFRIVPFEVEVEDDDQLPDESQPKKPSDPTSADSQNTLQVFQFLLERWRSSALATSYGEVDNEVALWDKMSKAVQEMEEFGLFTTKLNCLCHVDLHPGNIMGQIQSDGSFAVTGILDWDEAIFAPKFMSCMPPAWLWDDAVFDEHRVEDDGLDPWPYELRGANVTPSTLEKQELKRIFEHHAGSQWLRWAYDDSYRLCRGLFRIAREGLNDNQSWKAAERILEEWERMYRSRTFIGSYKRSYYDLSNSKAW